MRDGRIDRRRRDRGVPDRLSAEVGARSRSDCAHAERSRPRARIHGSVCGAGLRGLRRRPRPARRPRRHQRPRLHARPGEAPRRGRGHRARTHRVRRRRGESRAARRPAHARHRRRGRGGDARVHRRPHASTVPGRGLRHRRVHAGGGLARRVQGGDPRVRAPEPGPARDPRAAVALRLPRWTAARSGGDRRRLRRRPGGRGQAAALPDGRWAGIPAQLPRPRRAARAQSRRLRACAARARQPGTAHRSAAGRTWLRCARLLPARRVPRRSAGADDRHVRGGHWPCSARPV